MTTTPQEVVREESANSQVLQPTDMIPDELQDLEAVQNYALVANLTSTQRLILYALCSNLVSETKRTEAQIADDLGIHRNSIRDARLKPEFASALTAIMRDLIKGKADTPVQNLFNLAEKDVRANEILLRIADIYQPTQRNLNVNASIKGISAQSGSITDSIDTICIRLGELGWSRDRVVELAASIPARFDALKTEGAF